MRDVSGRRIGFVGLAALPAFRGPVQGTHFPQVHQPREQDRDKDADFNEAGPATFPDRDGPGIKKEGLHIKNDKKHGHQVKLGGEAETGIAHGDDTGFEGIFACAAPVTGAKEVGNAQHGDAEYGHHQQIDAEGPVMTECVESRIHLPA